MRGRLVYHDGLVNGVVAFGKSIALLGPWTEGHEILEYHERYCHDSSLGTEYQRDSCFAKQVFFCHNKCDQVISYKAVHTVLICLQLVR